MSSILTNHQSFSRTITTTMLAFVACIGLFVLTGCKDSFELYGGAEVYQQPTDKGVKVSTPIQPGRYMVTEPDGKDSIFESLIIAPGEGNFYHVTVQMRDNPQTKKRYKPDHYTAVVFKNDNGTHVVRLIDEAIVDHKPNTYFLMMAPASNGTWQIYFPQKFAADFYRAYLADFNAQLAKLQKQVNDLGVEVEITTKNATVEDTMEKMPFTKPEVNVEMFRQMGAHKAELPISKVLVRVGDAP